MRARTMKMTGSSSFFFGCGVDGWVLICNLSLSEEEDEDAMDVDSEPKPKPKPRNPDDLSEYNLDDYDNEVKTAGAFSLSYFQSFLTPNSGWSFQQYQRAHVLPRQRGGSIYHLKRGMCYSRKPRCSKSIWSRVSVSTRRRDFLVAFQDAQGLEQTEINLTRGELPRFFYGGRVEKGLPGVVTSSLSCNPCWICDFVFLSFSLHPTESRISAPALAWI